MRLRALTDGAVTGTGTVVLSGHPDGGLFGGAIVNADGSNAATVIVRKDNSSGEAIFHVVSTSTLPVHGPYAPAGDDTDTLYYSVTGTGASAQLYEWVP